MGHRDFTCEGQGGEIASGNIFIRHVHLQHARQDVPGHQHNFDHTTFVVDGAVHVLAAPDESVIADLRGHGLLPFPCDGCPDIAEPTRSMAELETLDWKVGTFSAGQHFLVRAGWFHRITALEPDTRFACIYSHRDPQGEVVQWDDGWSRDPHGHYQ